MSAPSAPMIAAPARAAGAAEASFEVVVTPESAIEFAKVSGDWNPLHTDPAHAAPTAYRRPVLHGAFSAGLISRLAGMHLPGIDCLLHGMRLRFIAPIVPPARLVVHGRVAHERAGSGRVDATVSDATDGRRYVEASYDFGRHEIVAAPAPPVVAAARTGTPVTLVTGASGGIGSAVLGRLGEGALGVSREPRDGMLHAPDPERLAEALGDRKVKAIVHCAWPSPDNARLTALAEPGAAVEHHVAGPLRQMIALAQLLRTHGTADAMLVLVGSTFARPGRHNYRMPLYTIGKSLIPELCRILAVELGPMGQRCVAVVYDVVEGGMNQRLSASARLRHADRVPAGRLPTAADAAAQVAWVLDNPGTLVSGAVLSLSGGAIP